MDRPRSAIARLAVARPLRSFTADDLITEACQLQKLQVRHVAVRRQQVNVIGEHTLRHVLDDHGIRISCLGFAGGFTGALGLSYQNAVSDVQKAIAVAAELGAGRIVIVPGERGTHTYRHAERTVRDGLADCIESASAHQIRLLVPTDTVLGGPSDCFRPQRSLLQWVDDLRCDTIRAMVVVRGASGAFRLPRGWREHVASGGCIRICHRCRNYAENARLLQSILRFLGHSDIGTSVDGGRCD